MKKALSLLFILLLALALTACGRVSGATVDYGASELYTKKDMDAAISLIKSQFRGWKGCELRSISYAGTNARMRIPSAG